MEQHETSHSIEYSNEFNSWELLEQGFVCFESGGEGVFFSYDLENTAEIPLPQVEVELAHGMTEVQNVPMSRRLVVDGTLYAIGSDGHFYRLDSAAWEWEDMGEYTGEYPGAGDAAPFYGKYVTTKEGVYDKNTGEMVFEYGELYPAISCYHKDIVDEYIGDDGILSYFGGDKYLGSNGKEFRWVYLTDMSMSEPLPFPEVDFEGIIILNDTYCAYGDDYGWFLWNYNDGTEEAMTLFGR